MKRRITIPAMAHSLRSLNRFNRKKTMPRSRMLLTLLLGLMLGSLFWWSQSNRTARAMFATYPLDPSTFTSLGPSPFGAGPGLYAINSSKALAAPVLTKPDNSTINGVFFTSSGGEIAVFTFDSITIPSDVTVQSVNALNTRPIALLSKGSITVAGTVNVSGNDNSRENGGNAGPGGGGGGGGGHGIGGKGTVNGIDGVGGGDLANGGSGGSVFPGGGGGPGVWVGDLQTGSGYFAGGGGFGGKGATGSVQTGNGLGGVAYGNLTTMLQGGGGGGGAHYFNEANTGGGGGGGGGAVEIGAIGDVTITGNIYANGGWSYLSFGDPFHPNVTNGGGGAGGGIIIHGANVDFSGAQEISAHGGGGGDFNLASNGGGGGRVHVIGASISEGCVDVNEAFTTVGNRPMAGVYTFSGTRLYHLQFDQQPTSTTPNTALSPAVTVRVVDGCGKLITSSTEVITLTLNNAAGATLSGNTANAVGGIATFSNLQVSSGGLGYRLTASGSNLTSATSDPFDIGCPTITITPGTGPTVFQGTTSATLPYTLSGIANQYSINYDLAANNLGFVDVNVGTLPASSPLTLTLPAAAPAGIYNATLSVRNSATGCASNIATFTVKILACPAGFIVNTLADTPDATPGDTFCADAAGNCSLRAAIQEANALTTPCSGTLVVTFALLGSIDLTSPLPDITRGLAINGPSTAPLTVRRVSGGAYRLFNFVNAGTSSVSGLTLVNGSTTGAGGAIQTISTQLTVSDCFFTGNQAGTGGAVASFSNGALTINRTTIDSNTATEAAGVFVQDHNSLIQNSTVSRNEATGNTGGIRNNAANASSAMILVNTTLSGNTSANTDSALRSEPSTGLTSTIRLTNCTITKNATTNAGQQGAVWLRPLGGTNVVTLRNTVVADNTSNGAFSDVTGGSLDAASSFNLVGTGGGLTDGVNRNITGVNNPLLSALINFGGLALTHAPLPGSPVIDAGTDCVLDNSCAPNPLGSNLTTDQRGFNRKAGSRVDIGAFESRGFALTMAGGSSQSTLIMTAFPTPLAVSVSSAFNEPVQGGLVKFTAPTNGASATLAGSPATIAANGQASVNATANGTVGSYNAAAQANGATPAAVNFALTNGCQAITVTPNATTLTGTAGLAFAQQFTQTGGIGATTFSLQSGTLPTGLTLAGNGSLSGTPLQTGTFPLVVKATDSNNCQGQTNYTLTIYCATIALAGLPNGTAGSPYTAQLQASPAGGNYQFSSADKPAWLTLTSAGGLSGMPPVVGSFSFNVTVTGFGACMRTLPVTLVVNCPALTLTPMLPNGVRGVVYNQSVTATPAGGNYTFTLTGGSLPPGLTFAANGHLSGTPTELGTFNFTLTATGFGVGPGSCSKAQTYTVVVACPTLTLTPAVLSSGVQGAAYSVTFGAVPSGTTYSYAVTVGALPPGLTLNSATGALTGTPTAGGTYNFAVTATGWGTCGKTQSYSLLITGTCPTVTLTPTALSSATMSQAYSQTLTATGGVAPYSFSLTQGALPPGLWLDSGSGVLSGTPTTGGSYSFRVTATSQGGCSGSHNYVVTVSCATLSFTPETLPNGVRGTGYNQRLAVSAPGDATFSVLLGNLPPGFTLSSAGMLSGITTQSGTYNFTVKALQGTCQGSKAYALVIVGGNAALTPALAQQADYDGDGRSDLVLWSNNGKWQLSLSNAAGHGVAQRLEQEPSWGTAGDLSLLGDYDGDGKTDLAVFRPANGTWYIKQSSVGSTLSKAWGTAGDVPVPGDYDGDGKTDLAVFRPSEGNWYVLRSADGQFSVTAWGAGYAPYHDVAVPGDYDGDGRSDLAVFRRATGTWLVKCSSHEYLTKAWGLGTDVPVAADYDGDGRTDFAVWRDSTWYLWQSASNNYRVIDWEAGTVPHLNQAAPRDYDGDGKADSAVWRAAEQIWYIRCSADGSLLLQRHGQAGDAPVQGR